MLVVLWLPRYYRDSIEAICVKFSGMGGDRSFTGCIMKVLMSSSMFQKNQKEKQVEEVQEDENEDKNMIK